MSALLLLVLMSCPAETGDEAARDVYLAGEEAYAAGRYDEAVDAYAKALEQSGKSELYFHLANTYERMGDKERAAAHLERYVECARPVDAALVSERARRLRDAVVAPPLAQPMCEETTEEPDARVVIAESLGELDAEPPRARPAPWLVASGTALAVAGGLALAAGSAGARPGCDGCRTAGGRDWAPALRGGAAVAATAAVVTGTVGVVLWLRF